MTMRSWRSSFSASLRGRSHHGHAAVNLVSLEGAGLHDLAALAGTFRCRPNLGPSLTLAGVLSLARRGRGLARALTLAGIDATALRTGGE